AELEMLNIEDPQGSMARDDADHDPEGPSRAPPASSGALQVRPRPVPERSQAQDDANHVPGEPSQPPPASDEGPQVRPKRMSVLFDTAGQKKPSAKQPAPIRTDPTGFHW